MLIRKTLNWEKRGDWRERAAASYIALLCLVWRENPWITYLGTKVHLMSTLKFSFEKENERKLAAMLEIFNSFRPVRLHLIFICNIINSNQNQPCKCMYFLWMMITKSMEMLYWTYSSCHFPHFCSHKNNFFFFG